MINGLYDDFSLINELIFRFTILNISYLKTSVLNVELSILNTPVMGFKSFGKRMKTL